MISYQSSARYLRRSLLSNISNRKIYFHSSLYRHQLLLRLCPLYRLNSPLQATPRRNLLLGNRPPRLLSQIKPKAMNSCNYLPLSRPSTPHSRSLRCPLRPKIWLGNRFRLKLLGMGRRGQVSRERQQLPRKLSNLNHHQYRRDQVTDKNLPICKMGERFQPIH